MTRKIRTRTDHNRQGHVRAEQLGFRELGPTPGGWRHAQVECVKCGHRVPWYHHRYQERHRKRCGSTVQGGGDDDSP